MARGWYRYFHRIPGLDIHDGGQIGLCAESHCKFLASIEFPETVERPERIYKSFCFCIQK
jgi:acyl-CoA thioester hydrolase